MLDNEKVIEQELVGPVFETQALDGSGRFVKGQRYLETRQRPGITVEFSDGTEELLTFVVTGILYED